MVPRRPFITFLLWAAAALNLSRCSYPIEEETIMHPDLARHLPPPSTGWAQSGKIRDKAALGDSVSMQAKLPEAGYYTCQFNLLNPSSTPVAPEALITWTVNGNYVTRRMSVINGAAVSGIAEHVKVVITDNTPSGDGSVQYIASVQVARGTRPSEEQPPILTRLGDFKKIVSAMSNATVTLPLDAGAISVRTTVWKNDVTGLVIARTDAAVVQYDSAGAALKSYSPIDENGWVSLAPNCQFVRFYNYTASDQVALLELGIEG